MSTRFYVCSSTTPKNNGLVKECTTRLELEEGYPMPLTYHCPTCAALLVPEDEGPSISELLAKGLAEERKQAERAK